MSENIWFEGIPWDGHFEWENTNGPDGTVGEWVEEKDWKRFLRPLTYVSDWHFGHGGDEYGNCTLFVRSPFGSIIWRYPTGHRQTDVEVYDTSNAAEWFTRVIEGRDSWLEQYRKGE